MQLQIPSTNSQHKWHFCESSVIPRDVPQVTDIHDSHRITRPAFPPPCDSRVECYAPSQRHF
ncbi:hypothetical protein E2C01_007666 [Portunus trituberculatus]|uniref:Uncharacterized protein n=1 Tax=Portunus trituberculatus TaxID=210409 RepID=A0A5B7D035_PORTR|nr:hypothetical protein [Portunus trituberculatus]